MVKLKRGMHDSERRTNLWLVKSRSAFATSLLSASIIVDVPQYTGCNTTGIVVSFNEKAVS